MSARLFELLDLIARWVHVIAGILWIGNSMLFNWLDRNLRPRGEGGAYGDLWLIHSGGFYLVEKNTGERDASGASRLPAPLHWFKWQAYITWLTGAVLLVVVYYAGGRALLVDPAVAAITPAQGIAVAVGSLAGGVLLYELLWRALGTRARVAAGALSLAAFVGVVYALTQLLSGRAAFLHVGALLGSVMAANVAGTIMPSQRELVAALAAGRMPDAAIADRAKQRSIHNNYLTFPVIFLMVSVHFPTYYAHHYNWLLLLVLAGAGAAVRHVMNIRFGFRHWVPALAATVAVSLLLLMLVAHLPPRRRASDAPAVPTAAALQFVEVQGVIDRRCVPCHAVRPSDPSFRVAASGIVLESSAQIRVLAQRIHERAVLTRTMPPGNRTGMTDAERALLADWIRKGAR